MNKMIKVLMGLYILCFLSLGLLSAYNWASSRGYEKAYKDLGWVRVDSDKHTRIGNIEFNVD